VVLLWASAAVTLAGLLAMLLATGIALEAGGLFADGPGIVNSSRCLWPLPSAAPEGSPTPPTVSASSSAVSWPWASAAQKTVRSGMLAKPASRPAWSARRPGLKAGAAGLVPAADDRISEASVAILASVALELLAGVVHPFPAFAQSHEVPCANEPPSTRGPVEADLRPRRPLSPAPLSVAATR